MTHGEALALAWRWCVLLQRRGVRRGDRIPLLLPTGPTFVGALLGVMLAGAIPVPLAAPMSLGSMDRYLANLAAIVADADATCMITYDRVTRALAAAPVLRDALRDVLTEADLEAPPPGFTAARAPAISGSDTALLQYTSGTTGRPKGVVISHRALVHNAAAIAASAGITEQDVGVSWLPLFHDMGLIGVLLTNVCHPYALHVMQPEAFVMRPGRWLQVLSEARATISAAPNFAYELCAAKVTDLDGLALDRWRCALNGSEPVLAPTARRFAERFAPCGWSSSAMTPVYGLAESTLAVTFSPVSRPMLTRRLDRDALALGAARASSSSSAIEAVSAGAPVRGTSLCIVDSHGKSQPERVVGRVRVAGPSLMDGYFRDELASAAALSGGWLDTGDLGFVQDEELFIVGRAREVIIKGGRNIYPYDLERVASEVAGVRAGSVAAFARPNAATGTDDVVVIAEADTAQPDERERIAKQIRGELLSALGVRADVVQAWPAGAIPRTTSGKVQRSACARKLAEREALRCARS
jgi:fatty-acyl-CoA synthase